MNYFKNLIDRILCIKQLERQNQIMKEALIKIYIENDQITNGSTSLGALIAMKALSLIKEI